VIDPDDPRLSGGGDMPHNIRNLCRETSQQVPTRRQSTRVIIDSLALSFRRTVRTIEEVSGDTADVIHFIGGGSANALLARLAASACERPCCAVRSRPPSWATRWCKPSPTGIEDLEHGRRLVERALPPRVVLPEATYSWPSLEDRLDAMRAD